MASVITVGGLPTSVTRSRGRPARSPDASERRAAVNDRRLRAIEEPLDVRLRTAETYPILEVRNPIHGTGYLVLLPKFPSEEAALCTCTDFARRGLGTCKHIEAGFRWLTDHPGAKPLRPAGGTTPRRSPLWKEIDRRLAARPTDRGPESLAWRRAGRLLFEPAATEPG